MEEKTDALRSTAEQKLLSEGENFSGEDFTDNEFALYYRGVEDGVTLFARELLKKMGGSHEGNMGT